jgi:hypothetical protein
MNGQLNLPGTTAVVAPITPAMKIGVMIAANTRIV